MLRNENILNYETLQKCFIDTYVLTMYCIFKHPLLAKLKSFGLTKQD